MAKIIDSTEALELELKVVKKAQEQFAEFTQEQVDNANLYVIDPFGVEQLKQLYAGHKKIICIYINVPMETCLDRMRRRGDNEDKIWERLRHDYDIFKGIYCRRTFMCYRSDFN